MTLCVTLGFYIQRARPFSKSKTICVTFYIQKPGHFALHNFHRIFGIGGGGGTFLYPKNSALCVTFLYAKYCTLCYVFTYKKPDTLRYILYTKRRHFSLRFYI